MQNYTKITIVKTCQQQNLNNRLRLENNESHLNKESRLEMQVADVASYWNKCRC